MALKDLLIQTFKTYWSKVVLISAGLNNRYHHPNDETLERFEAKKMMIYRTDQEGAIRYRGVKSWKVETVR